MTDVGMSTGTLDFNLASIDALDQDALPQLPGISYKRYINPDFFDLEIEHVFRKSWLCVGHVSEFPRAGSYKATDIPFAPVLIIRGRDGELRAFLNSCQHRGATVLRDKQGCTPVMTCPYHGWTYDLAGNLVGVTTPSCFPGLRKEDHALPQLRCEQWGGFIFVNFDQDAERLLDSLPASFRARYDDALAVSPERPIRRVFKYEWDVNCNWKALIDNFWETYHFQFLHPTTASAMLDSSRSSLKLFRKGHAEVVTPFQPPSHRTWKGPMNIIDSGLRSMPGISDTLARQLNALNVLVETFPNRTMNIANTGITIVTIWPVGVGSSRLIAEMFVEDWGDGPMPSKSAEDETDKAVFEEDMSCMSSIQQSLVGNPAGVIVLGSREAAIYNHQVEIDRMIGAENISPALRLPDMLRDHRSD